ncbi:hypothetical protein BASA50_006356 [Batrachochytrium salamandrivorans]|uniref:Crossover junction endonuclease MUS81-like HHH domain-containing protein n=1 Tax=Batrachochytrium salamandrivorans TaxID=1357716 RepID=A0ABQ8F9Y6_9FUNG|nr:hypothetical protein BASA62_006425 [Batrachochytrium salamandrivorans]KAH6575718.1 hypothetical protein BASA60_004863 [Batrachochytrium salamandrivorans]KAH6594678.1 hypothetical protein BASA50_006356 [Batrachochytrium salamandrivorans]KAH6599960.1 hypothetical protein BASA61_002427 [Batrachochytrium salamandrivorans]KAH9257527.1 hypothetical protein BASA81_004289 [Batrachochytrium salamandrivorans]
MTRTTTTTTRTAPTRASAYTQIAATHNASNKGTSQSTIGNVQAEAATSSNSKRPPTTTSSTAKRVKPTPTQARRKNSKQQQTQPDSQDQLNERNSQQTGSPNQDIIDLLDEIRQTETTNGNRYIANAYQKAIRAIRIYPTRFKSGNEAQQLAGIGAKIAAKIDEILTTGSLGRVLRDRATATVGTNAISNITA